jgi:hypothetical protein
VLTRCLSCYRAFPANGTLERLPVGRRIACDPARGRLWVVCSVCSAWTLQPIEERWETNDDIERLVRAARLLGSTDNISLFAVGDVHVVRVGRAALREEAWWRYGDQFTARRSHASRIVRRGKWIERALALAVTGVPFAGFNAEERWINHSRGRAFGRKAWAGPLTCARCGRTSRDFLFFDRDLFVDDATPGTARVRIPCVDCGTSRGAGAPLAGLPAEHLLRRALAWRNHAGGTEAAVRQAMVQVDEAPDIASFVTRFAGQPLALRGGAVTGSLALEIALNARIEQRQLALELEDLETRWRAEEKLASIIDGELTPFYRRRR